MVNVLLTDADDEKELLKDHCETAVVFLVNNRNVKAGVSGEISELRLKELEKQIPRILKDILKNAGDTFKNKVDVKKLKEEEIAKIKKKIGL